MNLDPWLAILVVTLAVIGITKFFMAFDARTARRDARRRNQARPTRTRDHVRRLR